MKYRIFQYAAMLAGPYFFGVNVVITIARRNLEPPIAALQTRRNLDTERQTGDWVNSILNSQWRIRAWATQLQIVTFDLFSFLKKD